MIDSQHNKMTSIKKLLLMREIAYHKIFNCFRWILSPLRRICTLFNILKPNVWIITGDEISSRQKLVIIYAGRELDKNFLAKLAFEGIFEENYLGKKWLWQIPRIVKEDNCGCSLAVIEVPHSFRKFSEKTKCLYIPGWICGETDILVDNPSLFKHRNTSLKSDLSKIRRNKLQFELTDELSQLHDFYYNMYIPYITKAHGDIAIIMSYDYMRSEFRKRGSCNNLLLIRKGTEYIAGMLLLRRKSKAKLWSIGVKDGNADYVRDGAIGALVYFSVEHLAGKGVTKFDLGRSRPFLKDGVLRFKKKWNARVSSIKKTGLWVKMLSEADGVKGFFLNNPFIYEGQTGLCGAIFVEGDHPLSRDYLAHLIKNYYLDGLSKLVIYRFGVAESTDCGGVPPEFSDNITVLSVKSIL